MFLDWPSGANGSPGGVVLHRGKRRRSHVAAFDWPSGANGNPGGVEMLHRGMFELFLDWPSGANGAPEWVELSHRGRCFDPAFRQLSG